MNRALTAFLIALLLSVARAAIPVEEIYPSQVAPGGLLQVKIKPPGDDMTCTARKTSLRIWIGSHSYPVTCEVRQDHWLLVMTLPEDAARSPQLGPQVLTVLAPGERPLPSSPPERKVQILDRITAVLSVQRNGSSEDYPPGQLGRLFESPLSRSDSTALANARAIVARDLANGEKAPVEAAELPESNGICGSTLYTTRLLTPALERQVGILIEQAKLLFPDPGTGIMVAPATAKQPPSGSVLWSTLQPSLLNAYAWKSIHLWEPVNDVGTPPSVYLIDTFDPDKGQASDPYETVSTFNDNPQRSLGHGSRVDELIRLVAPDAQMKYTQACDKDGICYLTQVISALCEASVEAITSSDRKVIVHLSLATPYDHPILRAGIDAATIYGAAIVAAYGNNDRCRDRAGGSLNYCNAYPADWFGERSGLYSVGASQQSNPAPQTFQRGQARLTRNADLDQPAMPVATPPSVTAPGFFFLPSDQQGVPTSAATPYWGTSFAAPLVTGALVRWVQAGNTNWPTPAQLKCGDKRLDLRSIASNCPD